MTETAAATAVMTEVEVKSWYGAGESRAYGWNRISVEAALRMQEDRFRCIECGGRVKLHWASTENEKAAYGVHHSKNPGCSLGDCFDGVKKPHLKPLN